MVVAPGVLIAGQERQERAAPRTMKDQSGRHIGQMPGVSRRRSRERRGLVELVELAEPRALRRSVGYAGSTTSMRLLR
jgi:hypothetical protein